MPCSIYIQAATRCDVRSRRFFGIAKIIREQSYWLGEPTDYARNHGLSYFDFAGIDASLGVDDEDGTVIEKKLAANPELQPVMQNGKATVFAVRPRTSAALRTAPLPPAQ